MTELGLFEAIHSCRALRRFKPNPIPDEVLTKVLGAAIQAPCGGNEQNWLFVVVRSDDQRRKLGDIYRRASAIVASWYERASKPAHMSEGQYRRFLTAGLYLHEHLADAPVLIVPCLNLGDSTPVLADRPQEPQLAMVDSVPWMAGASIYPAVQNLILACRAVGLGTCLTTNHLLFEDEVKKALGLPPTYRTFALLPIGYPVDSFGPVKRKPLSEVVALDEFGKVPSFLLGQSLQDQ
jgi:nitroreductase